jgi:hypothetical protein
MNNIALSALALPVAFIICSCLLLWVIIGSRGWWWLKLPISAVTVYFGLAVWYSVGSYLGWATPGDPPRQFIMHWAVVDEPSKTDGDEKGAIFFLLTKLPHKEDDLANTWQDRWFNVLGYSGDNKEPKLYKRPYSRPLHRAANGAMRMRMEGKYVIGEFKGGKFAKAGDGDGDGDGEGEPGDGKGKKGKDGKGLGYGGDNDNMGDFAFYVLPPPNYPPKKTGG